MDEDEVFGLDDVLPSWTVEDTEDIAEESDEDAAVDAQDQLAPPPPAGPIQ